MKIICETPLWEFKFWSGAKTNAETLSKEDFIYLEDIFEELYPEGLTETQINDIFWFDFNVILEWLGKDELLSDN